MKQALWLAGMFVASALQAAPELPAMPTPPDLRAYILQLLEQGRQDGRSIVILDANGEPVAPPPEGDLFRQWGEQRADEIPAPPPPPAVTAKPPAASPQIAPVEPPSPPAAQQLVRPEPPEEEQPLQLPSREITISGPEDLKRLQQAFDRAREAQQEQTK